MATAIEFNHVGKQYRLGLVSTGTLSHDLNRWWHTSILRKEDPYLKIGDVNDRASKANSDYVWALRDIDFKVEEGDVVGIIGKNGAGKSTLLKLLSKVTGPTVGTIRARGRIASLLEVGTGFHQEMTGRENIYMNGAILGMTKAEIAAKLDEIVDFSGCERYLDTPVKRYSSGMMVRLGFAVAAHLDPEILVVDEVLAVGDAEFQKKAIGKMQDVSRGEGRTVLFVSHNMASVKALCKSGVLLENGMVKHVGDISSTIEQYLSGKVQLYENLMDRFDAKTLPKMYVEDVRFTTGLGNSIDNTLSGEKVNIEVTICSEIKDTFDVNIGVYNMMGEKLLHLSTEYMNAQPIFIDEHRMKIVFTYERFPLPEGLYIFNVTLWSLGQRYDWVMDNIQLQVSGGDYYHSGKIPASSENKVLTDYTWTQQ
ncbi:MAG: ABC transporter ATP-binding protein [Paludibacteraceae bacterium]|nr:ABC transporter ATP-binding protein [Paludibacteraceae bacterium]